MYTNERVKEIIEGFFPEIKVDLTFYSPASLANYLEEKTFPVETLLREAISQVLKKEGVFSEITISLQLSAIAVEEKPSADIKIECKGVTSNYIAKFNPTSVDVEKQIFPESIVEGKKVEEEKEKPTIRILLVDDDPGTIRAIGRLLETAYPELKSRLAITAEAELTLENAFNGREALGKVLGLFAKKQRYDLIFMNHQMPVMTGREAIIKIREDEKTQGIRRQVIISLSASEMQKSIEVGADEFIAKPIKKVDIERILKQYIFKSLSSNCDSLQEIQELLHSYEQDGSIANAEKVRKTVYELFHKYCWQGDFPKNAEEKIAVLSEEGRLNFIYGFWGGLELFKRNLDSCKTYQNSDFIHNAYDYLWFVVWIAGHPQVASHKEIKIHIDNLNSYFSKIDGYLSHTTLRSSFEEVRNNYTNWLLSKKSITVQHQTSREISNLVAHVFELADYLDADTVHVAGTFNNWLEADNGKIDFSDNRLISWQMKKTSKGWELPKELPVGKYDYKFVINGKQWYPDTDNLILELTFPEKILSPS